MDGFDSPAAARATERDARSDAPTTIPAGTLRAAFAAQAAPAPAASAPYDANFPALGYLAAPRKRLQYLLLAGDLAAFAAALAFALWLAAGPAGLAAGAADPAPLLVAAAGLLLLGWGETAYLAGLYDFAGEEARPRTGAPLALAAFAAALLALPVLLVLLPAGSATGVALAFAPAAFLLASGARRLLASLHRGLRRPQRVLVIVDGPSGARTAARLRALMAPDRVVVEDIATLARRRHRQAESRADGTLAFPAAVAALLARGRYDLVAVDASAGTLGRADIEGLIGIRQRGARILHLPDLYKAVSGRVELDAVSEEWLLHALAAHRGAGPFYERAKRALDIAVAVPMLLIALPVMAVVALAVRLDSPGPALFVQERLGRHKRPFRCFKFRSMVQDAEARTGAVWATRGDPRVTRLGRILRATRLDELPQLFNVLLGEMSLVGPRPIRAHFAERLARTVPFYDLRFMAKPGLTGWSQIMMDAAENEAEQRVKFEYDLFYLESRSLLLDLYVLWRTVRVVFQRVGC